MNKNINININIIIIILSLYILSSFAIAEEDVFTVEEMDWIENHKDETLQFSLSSYSGMNFFEFKGEQSGYIINLVKLIEKITGLDIEIHGGSWSEAYSGLHSGKYDILFGANETDERLKTMTFTEPIQKYPYTVFANRNSDINVIGDFDFKRVGFVDNDIAIQFFIDYYENIDFEVVTYDIQTEGFDELESGNVDGFITSGGGMEYDFIYNYPNIKFIAEMDNITSDLTLSTKKEDEVLANILSKIIKNHKENEIKEYIAESEVIYNRKILQLTDKELDWLVGDGVAKIGVISNYLPFDYYEDGEYGGISGELFNEISNITGMKYEYLYGDFDYVYEKALLGEIDIINIAKTEERSEKFIFTEAFSDERDFIYGNKESEYVQDIYGLEGKTIAVVKGFWHKEFLNRNLRNAEIVETENIKESLKLINSGEVDYFIENPTVAEYYINGYGYWNTVKKGETSSDSFLRFGINKEKPEIASIMDKTLTLIDYNILKQKGLNTVPNVTSRIVYYMGTVILLLLIAVTAIGLSLSKSMKSLIIEKESTAALKEREHLMYIDPLTRVKNRLFYNLLEETIDDEEFPQSVLISDLNNLKNINDNLGHHMGDLYIETYSKILTDLVGDSEVCRMGGDEFLIVKTNCDENSIKELSNSIKNSLENKEIVVGDQVAVNIDAAIGYATRYNNFVTLEEIIIKADNEMYSNKKIQKSL